jgi:hypothetical protein
MTAIPSASSDSESSKLRKSTSLESVSSVASQRSDFLTPKPSPKLNALDADAFT